MEDIPQYADVPWPWGEFPRLPRTSWSPSPWRVALFDGDHRYEYSITTMFCIYLIIHLVMIAIRDIVGYPISIRPTIICGTLHATGTAMSATLILISGRYLASWQRVVLPCSISYFLADIVWYCLPNRDLTMTLHHLVMIGCHYPLGEANGALVAGAGDINWCLRLSMIGYLSEWTTALLNVRWFLARTAKPFNIGFRTISVLLLITYAYRLLLFPYLLLLEIFPRYLIYSQRQQVLTFYIMVLGHLLVLQLSIQWVAVICKYGICNFLLLARVRQQGQSPRMFDWRQSMFADDIK